MVADFHTLVFFRRAPLVPVVPLDLLANLERTYVYLYVFYMSSLWE